MDPVSLPPPCRNSANPDKGKPAARCGGLFFFQFLNALQRGAGRTALTRMPIGFTGHGLQMKFYGRPFFRVYRLPGAQDQCGFFRKQVFPQLFGFHCFPVIHLRGFLPEV